MKKFCFAAIAVICLLHMEAFAVKPLAKGDKAPLLKAMSIDGGEVEIVDFAGKYVYIDVWATWCAPCKAEIPYLKEMAQKLEGRNIVIMGLSWEKNRGKWAAMVKEEQLPGIQVSTGGDMYFREALGIDAIPRFILIDREGKIVNPDMTRPSNPLTLDTILSLEGI